jgi:hypothetical protein
VLGSDGLLDLQRVVYFLNTSRIFVVDDGADADAQRVGQSPEDVRGRL